MIIKKPSEDNQVRPASSGEDPPRMTYFWTWFNVLTMGLVDVVSEDKLDFDEEEVKRNEADKDLNQKTLAEALECLKTMRAAAYAFVREDRATNGWSEDNDIGLFFHCYPHCSVNSTHLHIVDLSTTGPTYDAIKQRNLKMDFVIEALEEEILLWSSNARQVIVHRDHRP